MTESSPRSLRRRRALAAAVDEPVAALIAVVLLAMAFTTGALEVLAVPVGRLVGPVADAVDVERPPLAIAGLALAIWGLVRFCYRVLGAGAPGGQTPGKRLAGVVVVGERDGRPPGYRRAAVREAVLAIELATVLGVVGALACPSWHDRAAGTRVGVIPPASATRDR